MGWAKDLADQLVRRRAVQDVLSDSQLKKDKLALRAIRKGESRDVRWAVIEPILERIRAAEDRDDADAQRLLRQVRTSEAALQKSVATIEALQKNLHTYSKRRPFPTTDSLRYEAIGKYIASSTVVMRQLRLLRMKLELILPAGAAKPQEKVWRNRLIDYLEDVGLSEGEIARGVRTLGIKVSGQQVRARLNYVQSR